MIQIQLPFFPEEITLINPTVGFIKKDHSVYYFNGSMPIFQHHEKDYASFRMITSQMAVMGVVRQAEIARAFGVTTISVKRWVKRYREEGASGFYKERGKRGSTVLTSDVIKLIEARLQDGEEVQEIAESMSIKAGTIGKAIRQGRIRGTKKKTME